jgi:RIO kinase 2
LIGKDGAKRLDVSVEASGFSKKMAKELEAYMKELGVDGDGDPNAARGDEESDEEEDDDDEDRDEENDLQHADDLEKVEDNEMSSKQDPVPGNSAATVDEAAADDISLATLQLKDKT